MLTLNDQQTGELRALFQRGLEIVGGDSGGTEPPQPVAMPRGEDLGCAPSEQAVLDFIAQRLPGFQRAHGPFPRNMVPQGEFVLSERVEPFTGRVRYGVLYSVYPGQTPADLTPPSDWLSA